mmetsp:Transcript_26884/g.88222  ORF Transcript_26884/g.88222 Transcript_26884/m.88222 type:complete len:220 (-) Transcript_26884:179-838(-)
MAHSSGVRPFRSALCPPGAVTWSTNVGVTSITIIVARVVATMCRRLRRSVYCPGLEYCSTAKISIQTTVDGARVLATAATSEPNVAPHACETNTSALLLAALIPGSSSSGTSTKRTRPAFIVSGFTTLSTTSHVASSQSPFSSANCTSHRTSTPLLMTASRLATATARDAAQSVPASASSERSGGSKPNRSGGGLFSCSAKVFPSRPSGSSGASSRPAT